MHTIHKAAEPIAYGHYYGLRLNRMLKPSRSWRLVAPLCWAESVGWRLQSVWLSALPAVSFTPRTQHAPTRQ